MTALTEIEVASVRPPRAMMRTKSTTERRAVSWVDSPDNHNGQFKVHSLILLSSAFDRNSMGKIRVDFVTGKQFKLRVPMHKSTYHPELVAKGFEITSKQLAVFKSKFVEAATVQFPELLEQSEPLYDDIIVNLPEACYPQPDKMICPEPTKGKGINYLCIRFNSKRPSVAVSAGAIAGSKMLDDSGVDADTMVDCFVSPNATKIQRRSQSSVRSGHSSNMSMNSRRSYHDEDEDGNWEPDEEFPRYNNRDATRDRTGVIPPSEENQYFLKTPNMNHIHSRIQRKNGHFQNPNKHQVFVKANHPSTMQKPPPPGGHTSRYGYHDHGSYMNNPPPLQEGIPFPPPPHHKNQHHGQQQHQHYAQPPRPVSSTQFNQSAVNTTANNPNQFFSRENVQDSGAGAYAEYHPPASFTTVPTAVSDMSGSASYGHHLTQGNAGYSNPCPSPALNEYERMHCTMSRKRSTFATETKKSRSSRSTDVYYEDQSDEDDNEDSIDEMSQAMESFNLVNDDDENPLESIHGGGCSASEIYHTPEGKDSHSNYFGSETIGDTITAEELREL